MIIFIIDLSSQFPSAQEFLLALSTTVLNQYSPFNDLKRREKQKMIVFLFEK